MQLTGSQRCAVFLLAMGEDVATDMLGRMQRQEIARITEAMASLPHVPESEAVSYTHLTLPTTPYV